MAQHRDCRSPSEVSQLNWMTRRSPANGSWPCQELYCALERQQRSLGRRHFHDDVIEVVGRSQEPQATAGVLPARVHVDEDRDDLVRVRVDASVLGAALAANRGRGRPTGKIESELVLEGLAKFVAVELVQQRLKSRAKFDFLTTGKLPDLEIFG